MRTLFLADASGSDFDDCGCKERQITPMRKSPRQRRLEADFRSVEKLDAESSIFSFVASGEPPTRYRLQFNGPGLSRSADGKIQIVHRHEIIVELGAAYPRMVPNLLWQTPVFHPNISNNGVVCLGGYGTHWVPSLTLSEMCTMLWDMIRYKNFDSDSPYNREAAMWAKVQNDFQFPIDQRSIRDRLGAQEAEALPEASPVVAVAQVARDSSDIEVAEVIEIVEDADSGADVDENEIEIIETGIEIIETNLDRSVSASNDEIIFLD